MEESRGIISCRNEQYTVTQNSTSSNECYRKKPKHLHELKYLHLHLELNCIHADVDMLVSLAAVLQVVKSFDLVQGVQQTPGEQIDPQHTGWVYTELQAIQLGVQVRGGHWKKEKKRREMLNYI